MNKKLSIIILIILAILAGYFYFTKTESTLKADLSDFAIEDTALVERVFIADFNGNTADLVRQENSTWRINDEYKARQDAIEILLKTFQTIEVKEHVPKAMLETVIKLMSSNSTKVEIYTGGTKPEKVYYVGHANSSHSGTNMLLEIGGKKSILPYVMHVPGFHGYLSTRFFTDIDLWRDRTIFSYEPEEINRVEVLYNEKPLKSFSLQRKNEDEFDIINVNSQEKVEEKNTEAIDEYIRRYKSFHFDYIDQEISEEYIDSVLQNKPIHIITVEHVDGRIDELKTYYKPDLGEGIINPATNEPYGYDLGNLYGWINETDFVVLQWQILENVLAYYEDFKLVENVDN